MIMMQTLLLILSLCVWGCHCNARTTPRVHLSYKELLETKTIRPFSFSFNTSDYRILHMDQDQGRLYLGSREYLVSLDMQNVNKEPLIIHWPATAQRKGECKLTGKGGQGECANFVRLIEPWNRTHLYNCGTGAYKPICTFINRGWRAEEYLFRLVTGYVDSGKGKSPYDPRQENAAALINGNLYAGVHVDFMGTDPAIFRTLGDRPAVRTEQYDSRWLNEPVFIKIQKIPDSAEKNDDKLYFFFREKSLDASGGSAPSVLARVGRVCLNDDGGQRSLVNKWTTFLKARLVCSVIGADGVETYFDEPRDVFIQRTHDERNPIVYAVFSTAGSVFKGSAVCVYSMADIRNVFNGPFSHKHGHNYQWTPYTGKIPYPRPGTCPGGTFTPDLHTTKAFSDEAVNFVRAHPLMYQPIYPIHKRPLVVRTGVDYRFTTIAVDLVDAVDGRYEVLFLGTDRGTVQKVIVLPKDISTTEELILEEVEVFKTPAAVKTLKISSKRLSRDKDVLKTGHGILLKSLTQLDAGLYHCLATENNFKHTVARISLRILDREIVDALTESDVPIEPEHHHHHSHHHPPPPPPPLQTNPPALQLHPQPEVRLINQYCQSYRQQIQSKPHKAKRNNRRHTGEQEGEELHVSSEWNSNG
ncbi:semaphorin-3F-like [Sinocyclocheilus anshuiensis]|uniref:semaphorin-3F-like n=1 Tax=Sinocyclocheilus anshuiensis TaxID=1608454 RepID=UPI0007B930F7|nr:PREDICTED: semaphorin-3F-like [Sinocyclocheilus anshuiensis]